MIILKKQILTRNYRIKPVLINKTFKIYNGKNYTELKILPNMIGYKMGEFYKTKSQKNIKK